MGNFPRDWCGNLPVAVSLACSAVCMDKIVAIIGKFTLYVLRDLYSCLLCVYVCSALTDFMTLYMYACLCVCISMFVGMYVHYIFHVHLSNEFAALMSLVV